MPNILCIETATTVCSVALSTDEKIFSREINEGFSHAEKLTVFIDEVVRDSKLRYKDLNAVAVSNGPGSYTGLRIGISAAKGLCFALDIPLISVSTLQAMAQGALNKLPGNSESFLLCPMIDARRMEVYSSLFDRRLNNITQTEAIVVDENYYSDFKNEKIFYFGDGAEKCRSILENNESFLFLPGIFLSSVFMIDLAAEKYLNNNFENLSIFEPNYLKQFKAGVKKSE
jgi:tRNA threonylcarbamoyladenosine biosynthesis protein TsaB